jgi:hypothetical protein
MKKEEEIYKDMLDLMKCLQNQIDLLDKKLIIQKNV